MLYIKDVFCNTIIINKSKFIATLMPISSLEEATTKLDEIRVKYFDATHNCYAYLLGDNWEIQKCSDDGEHQKTGEKVEMADASRRDAASAGSPPQTTTATRR